MPIAYKGSGEITQDQLDVSFLEDSFFRIYPNPSTGIFTLELEEVAEFSDIVIEIYTLMGEKITKLNTYTSLTYQINLTDRLPGIYLVKVMQNKKIGSIKLIKQ